MSTRVKVCLIGAGPGDPELITLKGRKLLDKADVIIYARSLVNPELLAGIKAEIHDSSGMTLDEIINLIALTQGKQIIFNVYEHIRSSERSEEFRRSEAKPDTL